MIFQIKTPEGTLYGVEVDKYGYTIKEWRVPQKEGAQPYWATARCAHYATFRGACRRLLELGISESQFQTLSELMERFEVWVDRVEFAARGTVTKGPDYLAPPISKPTIVQDEQPAEEAPQKEVPQWLLNVQRSMGVKR